MNFPTAYQYAIQGRPIARSSWGGGKWLTFEGGAWFVNSTDRSLVTSQGGDEGEEANITASDLLGQDWMLPPSCFVDPLPEMPDFPAKGVNMPAFDVNDPPCRV